MRDNLPKAGHWSQLDFGRHPSFNPKKTVSLTSTSLARLRPSEANFSLKFSPLASKRVCPLVQTPSPSPVQLRAVWRGARGLTLPGSAPLPLDPSVSAPCPLTPPTPAPSPKPTTLNTFNFSVLKAKGAGDDGNSTRLRLGEGLLGCTGAERHSTSLLTSLSLLPQLEKWG